MIADLQMLWDNYWLAAAVAFLFGMAAGVTGFRMAPAGGLPSRRWAGFAAGIAAVLVATAILHGPLGAGERVRSTLEKSARAELVYLEMAPVEARLARDPLSRRLMLSGPADDFQRSELVRIIGGLPGAADARWVDGSQRGIVLPLIAEAELLALAGFGLALVLSYLLELRRRSRAQWRW